MTKTRTYIFWSAYVCIMAACQAIFGDFPADFFAFPVNLAVMLLWMAVLWVLFREKPGSAAVRLLLSAQSTFILIAAFLACCLIQGFSPARLTGSWWFVSVTFALLTHLFMVLLRGVSRPRPHRIRFLLNHCGLFLAIAGGFFGSPDLRQWKTVLSGTETVSEAVDRHGNVTDTGYGMRLSRLHVDEYENGVPMNYEAAISVGEQSGIVLRVNHPYRLSWMDDLYLTGITDYGRDGAGTGSCIVEIVRQPWKYAEWTGILMLISGAVLLFLQGPAGRRDRRTVPDGKK